MASDIQFSLSLKSEELSNSKILGIDDVGSVESWSASQRSLVHSLWDPSLEVFSACWNLSRIT